MVSPMFNCSFLLLGLILQITAEQIPLYSSADRDQSQQDSYTFQWPIRRVAVIGAGLSGIIAYRELTQAGFDVRVFERDSLPGGNWRYTDETPVNAPVPNADVSVGDFMPTLPPNGVRLPYEEHYGGDEARELMRVHRSPKPIWESLRTNYPPPLQQFLDFPWPSGVPWPLPQEKVGQYVRAYASYHDANSNDGNPSVAYNTRVELVKQRFDKNGERAGWTLTLKEVTRTSESSVKAIWTKEDFDAVVVATGRFNAPFIPNIPGLQEWAKRFPDQIMHSRQYRRPQGYANKTMIVVGAAASGVEISIDLNPYASRIYQSVRNLNKPLPPGLLSSVYRNRLPRNTTMIGEIKRFLPPTSSMATSRLELFNGTIITGIDGIIFSTGFRYSFPFLPQYHNSSVRSLDNDDQVIVTDGTHLRNLYLDILSIEEPTLGFMDMNIGIQTFKYAEYIAAALTKVWSNTAEIPSTPRMRLWHDHHVSAKGGYTKDLQYMGIWRTTDMIRYFVGWLNDAAVKYGGRQLNPESPEELQIAITWYLAFYGVDITGIDHDTGPTEVMSSFPAMNLWNRWSLKDEGKLREVQKRIDEYLVDYDW